MGLLDDELNQIVSSNTKLRWALCIFCRVPFLTKYKINVCDRCEFNYEFYKKLLSKVMIMFIIFISVNTIVSIYSILYLFKHFSNIYLILASLSFESFIIGYILWKLMLKFIYDPKVNEL